MCLTNGGIIPACAGNTRTLPPTYYACRDHPRVCGEHRRRPRSACCRRGSSPRVRGTLKEQGVEIPVKGIIPACAGNTDAKATRLTASRDHPRVCGEHTFDSRRIDPARGSSPRVRGTLTPADQRAFADGIIPACAGNTVPQIFPHPSLRDHPRVCGEHYTRRLFHWLGQGSSPRVRGTRSRPRQATARRGIIPACAGNTTIV